MASLADSDLHFEYGGLAGADLYRKPDEDLPTDFRNA
jgi:hypothetical protein